MFRIAKTFRFAASHQLDQFPADHKCRRLHGHNYEVEFILEADLLDPATGVVRDYGEFTRAHEMVERIDHRHLNDFMDCPTAEFIARWLFDACFVDMPELVAVRVHETANTWAMYQR